MEKWQGLSSPTAQIQGERHVCISLTWSSGSSFSVTKDFSLKSQSTSLSHNRPSSGWLQDLHTVFTFQVLNLFISKDLCIPLCSSVVLLRLDLVTLKHIYRGNIRIKHPFSRHNLNPLGSHHDLTLVCGHSWPFFWTFNPSPQISAPFLVISCIVRSVLSILITLLFVSSSSFKNTSQPRCHLGAVP